MAPNAWAGCLSAHVQPVSLNPSSERTRHLRRNACPKSGGPRGRLSPNAHGNGRPARNCQFTSFTAVGLLSVAVPEIAGTGRLAFKSSDHLASAGLTG